MTRGQVVLGVDSFRLVAVIFFALLFIYAYLNINMMRASFSCHIDNLSKRSLFFLREVSSEQ